MSLNGLDKSNIIEAYKAVLAEAGGWFLLKYVSRDEIELLGRGSGGAVEIRDAISRYLEPSPLYGFIQYRRRKIILKYIPEKTSRLLQARVSVHFLAVCEKFAPYDAEFPITIAAELKETALSAACSLHTASASTSSSNSSLRRRKLAEITEDNEVTSKAAETIGQSALKESADSRPPQNQQSTSVPTLGSTVPQERLQTEPHRKVRSPVSTLGDSAAAPKKPQIERLSTAATVPLTRTRDEIDYDLRPSEDRRQSSQSTRPALRDLYETSAYGPKPKVKLGPRPSLDVDRRPRTSGSFFRQSESRPISTLPAGIRVSPRRPVQTRPKSQSSNFSPEGSIARPPVPQPPSHTANAPLRPVVRLSNVMPPPSPNHSILSKTGGMTPEKQRLMKALQLRKKQMTKVVQESPPRPQTESLAPCLIKGGQNPLADSKFIQEEMPRQIESSEVASNIISVAINGDINQPDSSPASLADSLEAASTSASSLSDSRIPEQKEKLSESTEAGAGGEVTIDLSASRNEKELSAVDAKPDDTAVDYYVTAKNEPRVINDATRISTESENIPSPSINKFQLEHDSIKEDEQLELEATKPNDANEPVQQEPQIPSEPALITEPHTVVNKSGLEASINGIGRRASKRRGLIELAPVDTSAEDSDENFLSDDSLMEELNLATVQEAKPIQVSKSPITPIFQVHGEHRRSDATRNSNYFRNISNPVAYSFGHDKSAPSSRVRASEIPRSVSATHASNVDSQGAPTAMAKKVNVSSGISKRIKALEQLSSREASPASSPLPPLPSSAHSNTSPSFTGLRQASLRSLKARSSSISPQPDSAPQRAYSPAPSSPPSPERHFRSFNRSDSPQAKFEALRDKQTDAATSDSNHIVRDHQLRDHDGRDRSFREAANRPGFQGLHQSTATIHAQTAGRPTYVGRTSSSKNNISPTGLPTASPAILNSPSSIVSASTDGNNSSEHSRSEPITPSSTQELAATGQRDLEERKDEKKGSRASRLFRRMSSMSSVSRKSLGQAISPSLKEEANPFDLDPPSSPHAHLRDLPQMPSQSRKTDIGDVNIQFPDTLVRVAVNPRDNVQQLIGPIKLWKRRCMVIDEQGYMVLSPPKSDQSLRSVTKRYHLSEFQSPFMPDQDRQELPNSECLLNCVVVAF
ncbi:MAG: hypothetical protein M1812_004283 [Candelaria pacifica]|nr:MAG: hypothetical protein M1812_004283 [Candelaria pacifica]